MPSPASGGQKHGLPNDSSDRKKIRDGLDDDEKKRFDEITKKIDSGGRPDRS